MLRLLNFLKDYKIIINSFVCLLSIINLKLDNIYINFIIIILEFICNLV